MVRSSPLSVALFAASELPGNEVWPQCDRFHEASRPQGGTHGCIFLPLVWEKARAEPESTMELEELSPPLSPPPTTITGGVGKRRSCDPPSSRSHTDPCWVPELLTWEGAAVITCRGNPGGLAIPVQSRQKGSLCSWS